MVFPACAGMFRLSSSTRTTSMSFPRVRGDVPSLGDGIKWVWEFSPRARGCSLGVLHPFLQTLVFPACAGMFRSGFRGQLCTRCFPRVRGDVPTPQGMRDFKKKVFPACAGMFPVMGVIGVSEFSFPRVRGDVPAHKTDTLFVGEFSHKHEDLPPLKTGNFSTGEYSPRKREHSGNPP